MSIKIISEKKTQIGQVTVTFTVGRIVSRAKETEGKPGMAVGKPHVRRNNRRSGFRVGEASADLPTTSEIMDVTARGDWHPTTEAIDGEQGAAKEPGSIQRERANPATTGTSSSTADIGGGQAGSGLCKMSRDAPRVSSVSSYRSGDKAILSQSGSRPEDEARNSQGRDSQMHSSLCELPRETALGGTANNVAGETAPNSTANAETHRTESAGSTPRAVFSAPTPPVESN